MSIVFWLYMALQYRFFHTFGGYFIKTGCFPVFNSCYYYVESYLSKLSEFDVQLDINNFCDRFISNLREFSKQILEKFFPHLYSFFLAGSFYFSAGHAFHFTHFICSLPRYSRLSTFYWNSNLIDLALNVFYLFSLLRVNWFSLYILNFLSIGVCWVIFIT